MRPGAPHDVCTPEAALDQQSHGKIVVYVRMKDIGCSRCQNDIQRLFDGDDARLVKESEKLPQDGKGTQYVPPSRHLHNPPHVAASSTNDCTRGPTAVMRNEKCAPCEWLASELDDRRHGTCLTLSAVE